MENDDWIKFGYEIWASEKGARKKQALQLYETAWTIIFKSEPGLDKGGPVNFLDNTQYGCSKPVPWRPEVEVRFSDPFTQTSTTVTLTADPVAHLPQIEPPLAAAVVGTDDVVDQELNNLWKNASIETVFETTFPRIKDGFFPGYLQYLEAHESQKPRLRATFIIIPQYTVLRHNNKPTCDVSAVQIAPNDMNVINAEDPDCLYLADDQSECDAGKSRYFCNSWVGLSLVVFLLLSDFYLHPSSSI